MENYMQYPTYIEKYPTYCPIQAAVMDTRSSANSVIVPAVTCVKFDPYQEIVWAGSSTGHLTGYYSPYMVKCSSLPVTESIEPIHDVIVELVDNAFTLSDSGITFVEKQGPVKTHIACAEIENSKRFCFDPSYPSVLLLAGDYPAVKMFNVETGKVSKTFTLFNETNYGTMPSANLMYPASPAKNQLGKNVSIPSRHKTANICQMRFVGRVLICGSQDGQLFFVDMRSPSPKIACVRAHTGKLNDLHDRASEHLVITCGYRNDGTLRKEHTVKSFDTRNFRMINELPVIHQPQFARFLPYSDIRVLAVSAEGCMAFVEFDQNSLLKPVNPGFTINGFSCQASALDISQTGQCVAMGSLHGYIYMLAVSNDQDLNPITPVFNYKSRKVLVPTSNPFVEEDEYQCPVWSNELPSSEILAHMLKRVPLDASLDSVDTEKVFFTSMIPFSVGKPGTHCLSDWPDSLVSNVMYRSQEAVKIPGYDTKTLSSFQRIPLPVGSSINKNGVWFPYSGKKYSTNNFLKMTGLCQSPEPHDDPSVLD